MANPDQTQASSHAEFYGTGPHRVLNQTMLGGGSAANLKLAAISATAGAVQPCAVEILSGVRTATGTYTLTFAGNHNAIAYMHASVDDVNGSTPIGAFLGQAANLGTNTPLTLVLTTYATGGGGSAADVALNTPIRIHVWFKDDNTGATA